MSRYIDAKWLEDNAKEYSLGYYDDDEYAVPLSALDSAPSIDIEPKRGEWIPYEASLNFGDGEGYVIEHKCSACGYLWGEPDYKFCPNCGADMREREGE